MKGALLTAAAALLGSAHAGVHKMKLKKIPLSEQLVSCRMPTLSRSSSKLQPRTTLTMFHNL